MREFREGDRGDEVADIQRRLTVAGYELGSGGADGSYGKQTVKAVREFQRARRLRSTGVADEPTWRALVEATYSLGDRLVYLRSPLLRGDDVRRLQIWLNKLGFNTGRVDGIFGEMTERAVREFQKSMGLPSDGIVGTSTIAALGGLRMVLEDGRSRVFPDAERRGSAVLIFAGRVIEVELGPRAIAPELCSDLALRLGNLLTLLGAEVSYAGVPPGVPEDAEISGSAPGGGVAEPARAGAGESAPDAAIHPPEFGVGFEACESGAGPPVSVRFFPKETTNPVGRRLAELVKDELTAALCLNGAALRFGRVGSGGMPALRIAIRLPGPRQGFSLEEELVRQKIAVAVFDGIKSYFRRLADSGSPAPAESNKRSPAPLGSDLA